MGSKNNRRHQEVVAVRLDEVNVSARTMEKLLRKDRGQIAEMRADIENGREMVPVILRPRIAGGYDIEDGRHRVVAAKLAGQTFIEALIVDE